MLLNIKFMKNIKQFSSLLQQYLILLVHMLKHIRKHSRHYRIIQTGVHAI